MDYVERPRRSVTAEANRAENADMGKDCEMVASKRGRQLRHQLVANATMDEDISAGWRHGIPLRGFGTTCGRLGLTAALDSSKGPM